MAWSKTRAQHEAPREQAMDNIAIALTQKSCLRNLELLVNAQRRRGYVDDEDYRKAIEEISAVRQWVAQVIVKESAVAME